jgi:hypothetical protein
MLSKFLRLRVTSKVSLELMGTPEGSPVLMFRPCDDLLGGHALWCEQCGVVEGTRTSLPISERRRDIRTT